MFAQSLIEYGAVSASKAGGRIDEISLRIRQIVETTKPETWTILGGVGILALLAWRRWSRDS